mgnify:CR=1 FL=1
MEDKIRELQELKRMREELEGEITALEDAVKADMGQREEVVVGPYKVTWKPVTSRRIDTAVMKKALPDVCARFMRETVVRRFCVN